VGVGVTPTCEAAGVAVMLTDIEGVMAGVPVGVFVTVADTDADSVGVAVMVGVRVRVTDGVIDAVGVMYKVCDRLGDIVMVGVTLGVGVGVGKASIYAI
jgi:hypothetical protein